MDSLAVQGLPDDLALVARAVVRLTSARPRAPGSPARLRLDRRHSQAARAPHRAAAPSAGPRAGPIGGTTPTARSRSPSGPAPSPRLPPGPTAVAAPPPPSPPRTRAGPAAAGAGPRPGGCAPPGGTPAGSQPLLHGHADVVAHQLGHRGPLVRRGRQDLGGRRVQQVYSPGTAARSESPPCSGSGGRPRCSRCPPPRRSRPGPPRGSRVARSGRPRRPGSAPCGQGHVSAYAHRPLWTQLRSRCSGTSTTRLRRYSPRPLACGSGRVDDATPSPRSPCTTKLTARRLGSS